MQLGIDIGTNFTRAAYQENAILTFLKDPVSGSTDIPTQLYIDENSQAFWGTAADTQRHSQRGRYYNRFMTMLESDDTSEYNPTALLKQFVRMLKTVVHDEFPNLVVAIPEAYGEFMRRRIKSTALEAGFEKVTLLSEPIAAMTAYGYKETLNVGEYALVVDCGGNVSKIALVVQNDTGLAVVAHKVEKGAGVVFDREIFNHVRHQLNDNVRQVIEQSEASEIREMLITECFRLKTQLNQLTEAYARFALPGVSGLVTLSLNSDNFYKIVVSHGEAIARTCKSLIDSANIDLGKICGVLACGASFRSPQLQQAVIRHIKLPLLRSQFEPGLIVAAGTAVYNLQSLDQSPIISSSQSIGIEEKSVNMPSSSELSPKSSKRNRQPSNYKVQDNPFEDLE